MAVIFFNIACSLWENDAIVGLFLETSNLIEPKLYMHCVIGWSITDFVVAWIGKPSWLFYIRFYWIRNKNLIIRNHKLP